MVEVQNIGRTASRRSLGVIIEQGFFVVTGSIALVFGEACVGATVTYITVTVKVLVFMRATSLGAHLLSGAFSGRTASVKNRFKELLLAFINRTEV